MGDGVGNDVGRRVGRVEGIEEVGCEEDVGGDEIAVGSKDIDGLSVGPRIGEWEGAMVGEEDGVKVGARLGMREGRGVVGTGDGSRDGSPVGASEKDCRH